MSDNRPNRRSTRLKDFDYSQPGAYYVTICTADRHCVLGEIRNGQLAASEWGRIATRCWEGVPDRWPPVELDQFVIMPNHVHGVLVFSDTGRPLPVLGTVINWYKASVTKAIRNTEGPVSLWQRGFHDHVVCDARDLDRIRQYIAMNPGKWEEDPYRPR